eukprot:1156606-Amphidinium_carterae.1
MRHHVQKQLVLLVFLTLSGFPGMWTGQKQRSLVVLHWAAEVLVHAQPSSKHRHAIVDCVLWHQPSTNTI